MTLKIKLELEDEDLSYFRKALEASKNKAKKVSDCDVLANAKKLTDSISGKMPKFVSNRLAKVGTLVDMIEDEEWQLPVDEKNNVISALSYFSEPEDMVNDLIPVLGYIDDAIMIELVMDDLTDSVEAFEEFVAYRKREEGRNGEDVVTREDWLGAKRRELHNRMRHRRAARRS